MGILPMTRGGMGILPMKHSHGLEARATLLEEETK